MEPLLCFEELLRRIYLARLPEGIHFRRRRVRKENIVFYYYNYALKGTYVHSG